MKNVRIAPRNAVREIKKLNPNALAFENPEWSKIPKSPIS